MNQLTEINKVAGLNIPLEKWEPLTDEMKTCIQNIAFKGKLYIEDWYQFIVLRGKSELLFVNYNSFVLQFKKYSDLVSQIQNGQLDSKEFLTKIFGL